MAKSKKQIQSRSLRKQGKSIKEIARKIGVSKSSVSIWCRDIELSAEQIARLHENMIKGSYEGRMKGARIQKERKEKKIGYYLIAGLRDIGKLSDRELFIAGLNLYWGEGNKKSGGVRFCNSDPIMIKFIIKWFLQSLKISPERFCLYININRIHKKRINLVRKFWINLTGISIEQFRKVILIKSKSKKIYENSDNYYGTADLRILKSTDLLYQIKGWIKGIENTAG